MLRLVNLDEFNLNFYVKAYKDNYGFTSINPNNECMHSMYRLDY